MGAEPAPSGRKRVEGRRPVLPALSPIRGRSARREAEGLDSLIHHRLRLGILSALAATDALSFNDLKALLRTTDGNLSVHARKLEEASYLICTKSFAGRRPKTEYRLALKGRQALERYVIHMEALIRATRRTLSGEGR